MKPASQAQPLGMEGFKVASADFHQPRSSWPCATGKPPIVPPAWPPVRSAQESGISKMKVPATPLQFHISTLFKDVNLRYSSGCANSRGSVGYSGHERGIEVPIAAAALGAVVIEKHITLDRSMDNDHKVSLLPNEFAQMIRDPPCRSLHGQRR